MKGFVPTPETLVDLMVEKLFEGRPPTAESTILDPGSGRGAFIDGILRYCMRQGIAVPRIVAVESDPAHVAHLVERFSRISEIDLREADFLTEMHGSFDYIIGNPPYVAITGLSEVEKATYRGLFRSAIGRFDLYILFFEKALVSLKPRGRLVFVTPEKYLYVSTASVLRTMLSERAVTELHFIEEEAFPGLVTYPLVTVVDPRVDGATCEITDRTGKCFDIPVPSGDASWLPLIASSPRQHGVLRLEDICSRVSCGIATGADSVFLLPAENVPEVLSPFAHRTIAGREIRDTELPRNRHVLLVPYADDGRLYSETELGALGAYLREPARYERLVQRTCVRAKPWYAFHENPPMRDLLRPKILCKDIGSAPLFVVDRVGDIVPRHSVYYIVPRSVSQIDELAEYLNSQQVAEWLSEHCQRAAKGFLRLQSHVIKQIPLPESFGTAPVEVQQLSLNVAERRRSA